MDLKIPGHPSTELYISVNAQGTSFFVYLEDVASDDSVTYITEGQLRASFRKLGDKITAPYQVEGPYYSFLNKDKEALTPNRVTPITIAF